MSHAKDLLTIQRALWDDGDRAHADRAAERLAASAERCREALKQFHRRFGHREFCDCCTCIDVRAALEAGDDAVREAG